MSTHWKPESRAKWLSPQDYAALSPAERKQLWVERQLSRHAQRFGPWPRGGTAGVAVVAALCVGVATGFYQAQRAAPVQPGAEIEWDAVQAVPKAQKSADDVAWERRAEAGSVEAYDGGAANEQGAGAVRVAFGSCKWGGGTNCVVDGDTFYINGEKIRIAGIDAPETHDYGCAGELALGDQATEHLQALLNSGAVTMTSIDRDRDRYGRRLRNVQVNGQDVGEAMVGAGVARDYAGGRRSWC